MYSGYCFSSNTKPLSIVSFSTVRAYHAPTLAVIDRYGDLFVKDLAAKDIKEHLNELAEKQYSIKTIKKYYTIYSAALQYAAEQGEVETNVARNVSMPKFAKKSVIRDPATPEEEQIIRDNIDVWLLPYFLLMTGLRKGEALALTYSDIDREKRLIHVSKAVAYNHTSKSPKRRLVCVTCLCWTSLRRISPMASQTNLYLHLIQAKTAPCL